MYSEKISERFQSLKNAGMVTNADAVGQVGAIGTGDLVKVYLRIVDGVITDAKFKTLGNVYTLVASDVLCDLLKKRSIENALLIKSEDILKELDHGIPENKLKIVDLVQSVIADAIEDYHKKQAKAQLNVKK